MTGTFLQGRGREDNNVVIPSDYDPHSPQSQGNREGFWHTLEMSPLGAAFSLIQGGDKACLKSTPTNVALQGCFTMFVEN